MGPQNGQPLCPCAMNAARVHMYNFPTGTWNPVWSAAAPQMPTGDPFNCPTCGAHDYGLYHLPGGECFWCLKKERDELKATVEEWAKDR
jgi:hypothetical protein